MIKHNDAGSPICYFQKYEPTLVGHPPTEESSCACAVVWESQKPLENGRLEKYRLLCFFMRTSKHDAKREYQRVTKVDHLRSLRKKCYQMIRRIFHSCGSRERVSSNSTTSRDCKVNWTILNNTEITTNHMTPEIKLYLLTPNCALYHEPVQNILEDNANVFVDPFWSIYWPGGQGLARFVLDNGKMLFSSSKTVLDLGAGCGAIAIAAKLRGAKEVVANDIDKVACAAIKLNARLNNVELNVSQENLLHRSPDATDYIFIGDMLYDEEITGILIPWLQKAKKNGTRIFVGDPGRHGLTNDLRNQLTLLKCYSLPDNVRKENHGYDKCYIWEFR
ncbi:electron transfer flavoprotein beta subunit lysine methyltransferase-like isoform X2 [Megachile rotundata]|uniref:electron transfer flavoprotein beta subunit lysine methyltransferase-like isoform X2 n=1 Tax=Megachile rotundata TaxID=143995 RepID=UPI003FCF3D67